MFYRDFTIQISLIVEGLRFKSMFINNYSYHNKKGHLKR